MIARFNRDVSDAAFETLAAVGWAACMLVVIVVALQSCATGGGSRAREVATALNVFASVIDPAYGLVEQSCAELERQARSQVGTRPLAEVDAQLEAPRARCVALSEAFEALRATHDHAAQLVEAGEFERAERLLQALRQRWAALPSTEAP